MKKIIITLFINSLAIICFAQNTIIDSAKPAAAIIDTSAKPVKKIDPNAITPDMYVAKYKDIAIREMKRMGVPAAISLAQGILETESGNSVLVKKSNNHFGIKCKNTWTGVGVRHDDDAPGECFRTYKTADDSYRDHSNFLRGSDRYASLFKLNPLDYNAWAYGLRKAGYATNPQYPAILIKNIEQYNLQQYSIMAANEMPIFETDKYTDDTVAIEIVEPEINKLVPAEKTILDSKEKPLIINGSKCMLAKKGSSLLVIASKSDISLSKLLEFNDLGEDGLLSKAQYIYLQKKSKTGATSYYIAQEGETLYDIAQKNGIQFAYLISYNGLKYDSIIHAGVKLFLTPTKSNIPLVEKKH